MTSHTERIIVLVDMDCFYCQVEELLNPKLTGKPIAVVQYNAWRGGGIIAVNYPARDRGVTRHMRGNEAKEKCPDIELVRVPNVRGKADLTKYREAGKRVAEVLQTFTPLLQRASVDEAYLDITEAVNSKISSMTDKLSLDMLPNTHVVGCDTNHFVHNVYNSYSEDCNLKLAVGGVIVEEIRAAVYEKTGYRCSAGIAHNKILAKLACGLHKPNKQTILPQDGVSQLYENLPLKKIKNLGGKFGNSLSEELNITNMGELERFSEQELARKFDEKTASWLYNIARGIDNEPVEVRLVSKSIGCCKKFPGRTALKTTEQVNHWLSELSTEIAERLEQDQEENNRRAKQLVISFAQEIDRKDVHGSKTSTLNSYEASRIATDAYEVLRKLTQRPDGCFKLKFLGLSAGKFEECKKVGDISLFFKPVAKNEQNFGSTPGKKKQDITNFFKTSTNENNNETNLSASLDTNKLSTCDRKQNLDSYDGGKQKETLEKDANKKSTFLTNYYLNDNLQNNSHLDENKENIVKALNKEISNNTFNSNSFIERFLNAHKNKRECLDNSKIIVKENSDELNIARETNKKQKVEDDFIHLSQIEDDTDIDLDETIKDIEELHRSIYEDENPYLNSTIEVDYTEKLKYKSEFPNKTSSSSNTDKIHTLIKTTNTNTSNIAENSNSNYSNFTSNALNENTNSNLSDFSSEQMSPIMNRTDLGDTSKSFFMRYAKKLEAAKKSLAMPISDQKKFNFSSYKSRNSNNTAQSHITSLNIQKESSFIADHEKPGCSYNVGRNRSPNIYDSDTNDTWHDGGHFENNNSNTFQITNAELQSANTHIHSESTLSSSTCSENVKLCPECNETVPETEYISHTDHHIALKFMAEEKQLFQEELQLAKQRNISKVATPAVKVKTKATKRKAKAIENSNCSIVSFLNKENHAENVVENMQQCPECRRQIDKAEFNCHMDFHTAKKLHLALNPVKVETKMQRTINKVVNKSAGDNKLVKKKSGCKNVNNTGVNSISRFFKPVEN